MRVAILTTSYPRFDGDPSGHFVETEAGEIARTGARVHVLAPGDTLAPHDGVVVEPLGATRLFGCPGALPRIRENPFRLLELAPFAARARRALVRGAYDRVIAHFLVPSGLLAAGTSGDVEVVAHGSDVRLLCAMPSPVRAAIVRRMAGARFRFVSEALATQLCASLPADLADRLDARVELPRITVPPQHRLRTPVWVTVGRLIPDKRTDLALLSAARSRAKLVVIGDGPERASLEALARALGADATFLGHVPRGEALAWIARADRLIHPSKAEGAPTVVREARALGVPVYASPVGDLGKWAAQDPGIVLSYSLE